MTAEQWDAFLRELSRRTRVGLPLSREVEADLDRRTLPFLECDIPTVATGPLADQAAVELDRITQAYNQGRGGWMRRFLRWASSIGSSLLRRSMAVFKRKCGDQIYRTIKARKAEIVQ